MNFKELINNKKYIIFDGAMGTMLQNKGMELGAIPELLNIDKPEWIVDVHKQYVEAGADIIYANTFGANSYKLKNAKYSVTEVIKAAIKNAREAVKGTDTLVALDIGTIGMLLEPTGTLRFEEAYDIYKEMILAGKDADLVVFETQTDLYELKAAVLAAKENSDLPVVCTMTFEMNHRTFTGCGVANMALTLNGLDVDAMGVNCSLGPTDLYEVIEELTKYTDKPIVVKPNAGLPDPITNEYDIDAGEFAKQMAGFKNYGVKCVGGCCGTNPDYIRELVTTFDENDGCELKRPDTIKELMICSATEVCVVDRPRIIGERINPTGKKKFKEALLNNDIDYILNQAIEQVNAGAEILDVNVGLPNIDEKEMMVKVIKAIQSVTFVPLQIDSTIPAVLEAALRVYNGKPIVNSVNGEEASMNNVLPLVAKYGAAVVCLTLDENGIPKKAEDRFAIAKKIMERAMEYGIPKENLIIDCLTLTASAEQDGVVETLKAISMVKEKLGLKTVLGVSNISFGLPGRELINHTFLAMALTHGLDLAIINPNVGSMSGTVKAFNVLKGYDRNSLEYIDSYNSTLQYMLASTVKKTTIVQGDSSTASASDDKNSLEYAIENGLINDGARITRELLKTKDSLAIVNEHLIPALDKAGDGFEKGKIFLPQLIMAADVAQAAFKVIKDEIAKSADNTVSKGTIVICTVKGDIHDIGKNIVKVLLENYGYTVIDLGKDVPYEEVLKATVEHKVKLVGLSALMTTTLVSMKETIDLLRANNVDCKVMVGGAVVTDDYAKSIGADYYSKDAKEAVDIAKEVFGNN